VRSAHKRWAECKQTDLLAPRDLALFPLRGVFTPIQGLYRMPSEEMEGWDGPVARSRARGAQWPRVATGHPSPARLCSSLTPVPEASWSMQGCVWCLNALCPIPAAMSAKRGRAGSTGTKFRMTLALPVAATMNCAGESVRPCAQPRSVRLGSGEEGRVFMLGVCRGAQTTPAPRTST
jgi:hypothetical protein